MNSPAYQGIIFPDRAESLRETTYASYRVFLDFWQPLADQLRDFYEPVKTRGDTRILLVYGPQGGGKTMFARKLATDFDKTSSGQDLQPSRDNLWHRVSGGTSAGAPRLDAELIKAARSATSLTSVTNDPNLSANYIPDDKNWMATLLKRVEGDRGRRWIVILDNAERGHFIQSLVELSDVDFLRMRDQPEAATLAAQRFVGHARTTLRGCLFVVLTNSLPFAAAVDQAINSQHQGMLVRTDLPLPGPTEKETVVRVNTNRLNRISYWYCLDRAGPTEKSAVYTALSGAETFPGSFSAVDSAIKSSVRLGRRAKTCLLTLVVIARTIDRTELSKLGTVWRDEVDHKWLSIQNFDEQWATPLLPPTDASLLESEWTLRVVAMGEEFVKSLLSGDAAQEKKCQDLLNQLKQAYGPGTFQRTLDANRAALTALVDTWPDNSAMDINATFWRLGQRRSTAYEPVLTRLLPGYNQSHDGFLNYRPDYVASPYVPCSILTAGSSNIDRINEAIYRNAHAIEFTAMDTFTVTNIRTYLQNKLRNYVEVVREQ